MLYLTGVSTDETRSAGRNDLGLLTTPDSKIHNDVPHYSVWAADNAFFKAPLPDATGRDDDVLGEPCYATPSSRAVRYTSETPHEKRWWKYLDQLDAATCLFVTLPDVLGDYAATWERSCMWITRTKARGFKVAVVLQDGIENDKFVFGSILNGADAVFIGGSDEWKLNADIIGSLVAKAHERGLWVHMGRVNSKKRFKYAERIGCDSADGTILAFGPKANWPRVQSWLDGRNIATSSSTTQEGAAMPKPKATEEVAVPVGDMDLATLRPLANAEFCKLTRWHNSGRPEGKKPITIHFDELQRRHNIMPNKATTKKNNGGTIQRGATVQFCVNGEAMPEGNNHLARIAIQYTRGCGKNGDKLGAAELIALLEKDGIKDPRNTTWKFTLPNGVELSAVKMGSVKPSGKMPSRKIASMSTATKATAASKSTAKKSTATKSTAKKSTAKKSTATVTKVPRSTPTKETPGAKKRRLEAEAKANGKSVDVTPIPKKGTAKKAVAASKAKAPRVTKRVAAKR